MTFLRYEDGMINLDQVEDVTVDTDANGGAVTFHLVSGRTVGVGTFAGTKADALLALTRITRAVDSEVYDTRNYEE